jgi:hypothetical protein
LLVFCQSTNFRAKKRVYCCGCSFLSGFHFSSRNRRGL